ncbi:MAG: Stp1/IreP family PP2C-type Ser/Thr phosphatase [Elusimicrobia bacterium]|nr:Stp1/IreP family PP2C-type Ser/Thr phosphatase [Elusimicrobiota bacterium]
MTMQLEYAVKTDIGRKRQLNEDSYGFSSEKQVFFVCDGMGGHAAGDYASQTVVETISKLIRLEPDAELARTIIQEPGYIPPECRQFISLIMLANRRLLKLAMMYPKLRGMGTTITSVFFSEGFVNVVNVGDSRVYRLRDGNLKQLSTDHTWMEELLEDGELNKQDLDTFNKKNVITRAIGTSPNVQVDWKASDLKEEDIYLMCSDGLYGEVKDEAIQDIMRRNSDDLKQGSEELIRAANDGGGADNITVILVKVKSPAGETSGGLKTEETVTLTADKDNTARIDSYIDKYYPPSRTRVPEGIEKEKQKIHHNSYFITMIAVMLLVGAVVLIKKPWVQKPVGSEAMQKKCDILIRTMPSGSEVSIYFNGQMLSKKISPADFLALEEGDYEIKISRQGFSDKALTVRAVRGRQEVRNIPLEAMKKLELSLGMNPGFEPTDGVLLDGEPIKYYGVPLTVQRVGIVGKIVDISQDSHLFQVGSATRTITVGSDQGMVKIKLDEGKIVIEEGE